MLPEASQQSSVDLSDHESEDAYDSLDLGAVEQPVQAFDDERDAATAQLLHDGPESFATERNSTAQSDHDRPRGSESGPS